MSTMIHRRPGQQIGSVLFALAIVILIVGMFTVLLGGCTPAPQARPEAPLATGASVAPPATCVALRKKGGSC